MIFKNILINNFKHYPFLHQAKAFKIFFMEPKIPNYKGETINPSNIYSLFDLPWHQKSIL